MFMTKKLRRTEDFEIALTIRKDSFIRPPRDAQRNALLNGALDELSTDLKALDDLASRFVKGAPRIILGDRASEVVSNDDIMEDWQIPLMQRMAEIVAESHGDVLEIGFGKGVSSTMIQKQEVRSHTIIECNNSIVSMFRSWQELYKERDIKLVHGLWQDKIDDLGLFDGVFFHTYPLNEEEIVKYVYRSVTFAEHFFESAAKHLRSGGVFTYFSNEIDSLSRGHQRSLFEHFSSISLRKIDLDIPDDVEDTWWSNSMVVVKAVK